MSTSTVAADIVVNAPDFNDKSETILLGIDASWVNENRVHGRFQRVFDFWPLVYGAPPPVNNIGRHEGGDLSGHSGLMRTHAVARGLERPIGNSDNGDNVYVFLSKPVYHYEYEVGMVCLAKRVECPKNVVFACYVRDIRAETPTGISGMILSWEWVTSDPNEPDMPENYRDRYDTIVWRRRCLTLQQRMR